MSNTTLTDKFERPLRDLRISVTDRCNFRCTYCMPAEIFGENYVFLNKQQILSFEEITRLTRLIVSQGAVKLRLTGGEPLVRQQLEVLISQLDALEGVEDIAMTTNAKLLTPEKATALRDAGLRRMTVSLDTLDEAVFQQMNGKRATVEDVLRGISVAEDAGFAPIKINCVVQKGVNDHTIVDLAALARERGYIIRFIEYMDVGTRNGWDMKHVVPAREILERIDARFPLERARMNYYGEVALRYRYADGEGEMGIIASVTQPFCGSCTRMRLSP
ncbi:MAG: GTP 3',8-cyclase MoaA, partial [Chloroflexota bacterium]